LRHALELSGADASREQISSGVMMIPVPQSGIFESVSGEQQAAATPSVTQIAITARAHDYLAAWPEGASYLGFIFARGENPETVENALRLAHGNLQFQITPRLVVHHPSSQS
jgi:L-amino acid ligase C-terminal domain 2